jgi:hypothetical protein
VLAAPKSGKTAPPIPHVSLKTEPPEPEKEPAPFDVRAVAKKKRVVFLAAGIAAVIVLGGISFVAYRMLLTPTPVPPPPAAKTKVPAPTAAKAPTAAAPVAAATTAPATPAAAAPATPSATLNSLAHVPVNAINKAQGAIDARRASGQSNLDAAVTGQELADKPAVAAPSVTAPSVPSAPAPKPANATAKTSITRGISATTELESAAVEASPEFRSFVANAKISGVFQGTPARAFINGRMARAGDTIDLTLGIIFETIDPAKRHLTFKDKSGAMVSRKY